jgi:transcriptional regulator GlxA family with amidase domain
MKRRVMLWSGLAAVVLFLVIGAGFMTSLPPTPAPAAAPPIAQAERSATLAALAPPKRTRPLVAIIGINDATETTDYLMPYGILRRADIADVVALSTEPGPVNLYPALRVEADATVAQFDAQHPQGADYVIVPAMSRDDDPAALLWIRSQAAKGAIVIGVCFGAKVVGAAGLLEGKRATTHWYALDDLRDRTPSIQYVADRRFVVDQGVATTTGISASMPMSLTLIEAIAGRDKAMAVARDLGVTHWDARHVSAAFKVTRRFALTVMGNVLAFWNRDQVGIEITRGVDEVSLALVADAWSRTYRSSAVTFATSAGALESRNGIRILPDQIAASWPAQQLLPAIGGRPPAQALNDALAGIERRYGTATASVVAMQLELPRNGVRADPSLPSWNLLSGEPSLRWRLRA